MRKQMKMKTEFSGVRATYTFSLIVVSWSVASWGTVLNRFLGGVRIVIAVRPSPTVSMSPVWSSLRKLPIGTSTPKSNVSVGLAWLKPGATILMSEATSKWVCCVNMLGNTGRTTLLFILCTDDLRLMVMRDIMATVRLNESRRRWGLWGGFESKWNTYSNSSWAVIFLIPGGALAIIMLNTKVTAKITLWK